ncbi:MAG: DNA cytosine methyltransferase [Candidatus Nanohaloarchaea archaeon]
MPELNSIDLFCGAGGTSTGLISANYNVEVGVDLDEKAIKSFDYNHKDTEALQEDISDLDVGSFDEYRNNLFLLNASPPCQSFSNANRHSGEESEKDYLYREVVRFAEHLQPKYVLMENVRGMNKILGDVKRDFSEAGYEIDSVLVNSKNFGVPQNRDRLIFLGIRKDLARIDPQMLLNKLKMEVSSRKNSEEVPLEKVFWGLRELEPKSEKLKTEKESKKTGFTEDEIQEEGNPNDYVRKINRGKIPKKVYNHKARYHNERDQKIYELLPQGENAEHESIQDILPYKLGSFKDKYYKLHPEEVSKTITAHMSRDCNSYIHPEEDRGLTPREAARIQSFPDDYRFHGPFTEWYRQIGNAVPPLMAKEIGEAIKNHHEKHIS